MSDILLQVFETTVRRETSAFCKREIGGEKRKSGSNIHVSRTKKKKTPTEEHAFRGWNDPFGDTLTYCACRRELLHHPAVSASWCRRRKHMHQQVDVSARKERQSSPLSTKPHESSCDDSVFGRDSRFFCRSTEHRSTNGPFGCVALASQ